MTEFYELSKGLTDIPLVLLAAGISWFLYRRLGRFRAWPLVYLLIAVAALMGVIVHSFVLSAGVKSVIWVFLYIPLFELARRYALLTRALLSGEDTPDPPVVPILEAILYLTAVVFCFYPVIDSLFLFLAFGAWEIVRVAVFLFRYPKRASSVLTVLGLCALSVILQAFSFFIPYAVVGEHILLAAALMLNAFFVKKAAMNPKEKDPAV